MDFRGFGQTSFGIDQTTPREELLRRLQEQQQVPQPKKKSGWTAWLSELGGAGGAGAGAAIGSAILPGIGTLVGAGLGGLIGGTGGSAVEQKVRDDKVDWGKAVTTGAIEGVASAGPVRLLKAGNAARKAVKAGEAVRPAVDEAISNTLLSRMAGRAGKSLETTGGKVMNTQTNLTRAEMRRIGVNTPEMFMQMNRKYGLTKLDDVAEVSRNVTGQNGVHSEAVRNVLFNGPGVDTADIRGSLPTLLDRKAPLVDGPARKRVQTQVDNAIQSMYADQPLNPLANPGAAFDVAKSFRGQARQLRTGANPSGAEKQLSQVYDELAGSLEKKLYSQPGVEEALPLVRDGMVKTYKQLASQAMGAQRKAYENLAQEASHMKTVGDLRTAQKIWVEASQVDQKTAEAAGNAATKLSGGGGLLSRAGNAALDALSPRIGGAAASAGRAVSGTGSLMAGVNNPATRALVGAGVANAVTASPQAQQDDLMTQMNNADRPPQDQMGGGIPMGQDWTPSITGSSTSREGTPDYYLAGAQRAAAEGDFESAKMLMGMASTVAEIDASSDSKLSNNQQKGVLAMQNALSQVEQLEQLYNQAGGGQGRIGGAVSGLLGRVGANAEAQAYRQKRAGAAALIARALGESGTMTDQDIKRALDQIPDIDNTAQEAQIKWSAIKQILNQVGQNTLNLGGGDLLTQMNGN